MRRPSGDTAKVFSNGVATNASLSDVTILKRETSRDGSGRRQAQTAAATDAAASTETAMNDGVNTFGEVPSAPVAAPANVALVNEVFVSASLNAFALSKRSAGSFSSDFATAAAMFGGTDLRCFVTELRGLGDDLHDDLLRGAAEVRRAGRSASRTARSQASTRPSAR